jgi:hypothetical protein
MRERFDRMTPVRKELGHRGRVRRGARSSHDKAARGAGGIGVEMTARVSDLDLATLEDAASHHVKYSYIPSLRRCVDAGLCWFADEGRGHLVLTDKGKVALMSLARDAQKEAVAKLPKLGGR